MQQYAEEGQAEPGPAVLLSGGRVARALLRQRPRLSGRLVRVRADNCQGNPSNYDRNTPAPPPPPPPSPLRSGPVPSGPAGRMTTGVMDGAAFVFYRCFSLSPPSPRPPSTRPA